MANKISSATKVVIPCRISFANIFEAKSINGGEAKYSVSCLIRDLLDAVQDYAGEELRREIEEYIETNVQDIDDYEKEYDRMEQENPAGEVNYRHFVMLGRASRLMVSIKHAIFGKLSERPIDF